MTSEFLDLIQRFGAWLRTGHWFWFGLTVAVLVWYSTVTVYVAIRGAFDVKQMLRNLAKRDERS